jgi:hypothetical protein
MTEELLKKKAIKSERRREVAAQKREKEKVLITYVFFHRCNLNWCFSRLLRNEPSIAFS